MGITAKFTEADIQQHLDRFYQTVERRAIQRLQYLGELCVNHAKDLPAVVSYTDQTGNLRSSIGFMVFRNGLSIHSGFTGSNLSGSFEGSSQGMSLALQVGREYPKGLVLVVVAGMNYAVHVESQGRDVITSAEQLAVDVLPKMLESLKRNINNAL